MNPNSHSKSQAKIGYLLVSVAAFSLMVYFGGRAVNKTFNKETPLALSTQVPQVREPSSTTSLGQPIHSIRVGQRTLGMNPDRDDVDNRQPEPNELNWRQISLKLYKADGEQLDIELLRPVSWIDNHGAMPGTSISLDLAELGAQGSAEVLAVEPCPKLQPGPGNVVIGTFAHHSSCQLLNINVEGEDEPIGVTDNHSIWSETRQRYVLAGDLTVGESLLHERGPALIKSISPRGQPEPVYNIEVHGENVYRVTRSGVLVHSRHKDEHKSM